MIRFFLLLSGLLLRQARPGYICTPPPSCSRSGSSVLACPYAGGAHLCLESFRCRFIIFLENFRSCNFLNHWLQKNELDCPLEFCTGINPLGLDIIFHSEILTSSLFSPILGANFPLAFLYKPFFPRDLLSGRNALEGPASRSPLFRGMKAPPFSTCLSPVLNQFPLIYFRGARCLPLMITFFFLDQPFFPSDRPTKRDDLP